MDSGFNCRTVVSKQNVVNSHPIVEEINKWQQLPTEIIKIIFDCDLGNPNQSPISKTFETKERKFEIKKRFLNSGAQLKIFKDMYFEKIVEYINKYELTNVNLSAQNYDVDDIKDLGEKCPQLKHLNISLESPRGFTFMMEDWECLVLKKLNLDTLKLKCFGFRHCFFSLHGIEKLPIIELTLNKCSIDNVDFLTNLRFITLLNLKQNPISSLNSLIGLTNLQTLNISQTQIEDSELKYIEKLPIQKIRLNENKLSGKGLVYLNTEALNSLNLTNCISFQFSELRKLHKMKLISLKLKRCNITDLSELGNLEDLMLENLDISDTKILDISNIKKLTKLVSLRIGSTSIPNDNLTNLEGMSLKFLDLRGYIITKEGAKYFENLSVEELSLNNFTSELAVAVIKIKGLKVLNLTSYYHFWDWDNNGKKALRYLFTFTKIKINY